LALVTKAYESSEVRLQGEVQPVQCRSKVNAELTVIRSSQWLSEIRRRGGESCEQCCARNPVMLPWGRAMA
jgi:hypothetical protein